MDSDCDLEILYGAANIIGGTVVYVEASLQTISAPTTSEQTGDSFEQTGLH